MITHHGNQKNSAMADKEQVRPLAPAALRINVDDNDHGAMSMEPKKQHYWNRKYVTCCGCIVALMLIQAMAILVLFFTVLRVKNPVLKIDSEKVEGLDGVISNATALLPPSKNLTFTINFRLKNPNVASFRFGNISTSLYYGGVLVGEGRSPPGVAGARRTLQMNVTVNVMAEKMSTVSGLKSDLSSGALNVSSHTLIGGKVKILNVIKKHVEVKMNCTMTVNITSNAIENQICNGHGRP